MNQRRLLQPGEIIGGKYKILQQCGQGGMSVVYQVSDTHLNKNWALKEVRKDGTIDYNLVRQGLIVETNMLKKLSHPNLPRIVDVIDESDVIYVVMDFIEGQPLDKVLSEYGAQPQDMVIDWAKQLCDVLSYLHSRTPPIIYRDMKPGNVMLKPEGNITLFDFGIAREYKEKNLADTTCLGTQGYAAPEQFGGQGQTDPRTDIYCLGATLYHLVTGQNPAEPPYEMYPIRQWNPNLSSGLERIILKCTQRDPKERYQSCAELMYDLEHYNEIDDAFRKKQVKKLVGFCIPAALCVASLAFSGICYINMKSELRQNYDNMLSVANNLATQSVYDASFDKEVLTTFNETIKIDPSREEGYSKLIDYCASIGQTQAGLDQVCTMVDSGQGHIDQNNELLMRIARLYFGGNTADPAFTVNYDKAAKYFSMVDARSYPESSYFAEMATAMGSLSSAVDWPSVVSTLDAVESYTDGQSYSVAAANNYQLISGVYIANKRVIMDSGIDPMVKAVGCLKKAETIVEALTEDVNMGTTVKDSNLLPQMQPEIYSSLVTAYYSGSTIGSAATDYDSAIATLQQLRSIQDNEEAVKATDYRMADIYQQAKNYDAAEDIYRSLMNRYPQESKAFVNCAVMTFDRGNLEQAAELCRRAANTADVQSNSNYPKLRTKLHNAGLL